MSHFTTLVIIDTLDETTIDEKLTELLEPFAEFECTGEDTQYIQDIDITEDVLSAYAKSDEDETIGEYIDGYYGYPQLTDTFDEEHKYGFYTLHDDGTLKSCIRRTNPNATWDWWVVGGRWSNSFLLKSGKRADICTKDSLDLAKMQDIAVEEASATYDKFHHLSNGRRIIDWVTIRDSHENIDDARAEYREQEVLKDVKADEEFCWLDNFSKFYVTKDEYLKTAKESALSTYSIVYNGKWISKGEMGWFGMSSNETDNWQTTFNDIYNSLPSNTILVMVDCHI